MLPQMMTLGTYAQAVSEDKRAAQRKITSQLGMGMTGRNLAMPAMALSGPVHVPNSADAGSKSVIYWWAQKDSNLRLPPCEGADLMSTY